MATGTASFANLGSTTSFPLFQTAIDGTFGGDSATTNAGANLTVQPAGSSTLTVNNPALNVSGISTTAFPGVQVGTYSVAAEVQSGNLDYTRFGYWLRYQATEGLWQASAFSGGFLAPSGAIPSSGSATYAGTASGIYNDQAPCNCSNAFVSRFTGNVNLTANFGQSTIDGSIKNIIMTSIGQTPGVMNDIGFSATIDRQANLFAGNASVLTTPGGAWAFSNAASGRVDGRFYGPTAQEIGAIFQLTEGVKRLVGSFGAKGN